MLAIVVVQTNNVDTVVGVGVVLVFLRFLLILFFSCSMFCSIPFTYILTARTETSHKASLRSVTNQASYNLRRRSPRAAESGNETSTSATLRCVTNQNGQSSRKCPRIAESDGETPNNALLRNVTNPKSNRRRSPRFVESGSEIPNIGEEKIIAKKAQKTKVKEAKNESNRKPFVVDPHKPKVQALKQYACMPSSIIEDQEKDVKKAKGDYYYYVFIII
jgi:Na+-transporting methylmalonyl-CoA/oxaloacetate decarboxylase gamma subunit